MVEDYKYVCRYYNIPHLYVPDSGEIVSKHTHQWMVFNKPYRVLPLLYVLYWAHSRDDVREETCDMWVDI